MQYRTRNLYIGPPGKALENHSLYRIAANFGRLYRLGD
jgi:hypothetical protein